MDVAIGTQLGSMLSGRRTGLELRIIVGEPILAAAAVKIGPRPRSLSAISTINRFGTNQGPSCLSRAAMARSWPGLRAARMIRAAAEDREMPAWQWTRMRSRSDSAPASSMMLPT